MRKNIIQVKSMCLILNDGKLLVNRGYDSVKKQSFYRLIGGKVEFREPCIETIKREVREELYTEITDLEFITAKEEIFIYQGKPCHEVVFLYKGKITDPNLLAAELIPNPDAEDFPAVWISVSDLLEKQIPLYPEFDYKHLLLLE